MRTGGSVMDSELAKYILEEVNKKTLTQITGKDTIFTDLGFSLKIILIFLIYL